MIFRLLQPVCKRSFFNLKYCGDSQKLFCRNIMAPKKALVFLSEGSEEMEFVISVDVLRRAGIEVTAAGVQGTSSVTCSRGVKISPDVDIKDAAASGPFDVMVLPGGLQGAQAFSESATVGAMLKDQETAGRLIAAICAAPTSLKAHGIAKGKKLTCYPSLEGDLMQGSQYEYSQENVVVDGTLITSRGPGTAFEFALAIVQQLLGEAAAKEVAKPMLLA